MNRNREVLKLLGMTNRGTGEPAPDPDRSYTAVVIRNDDEGRALVARPGADSRSPLGPCRGLRGVQPGSEVLCVPTYWGTWVVAVDGTPAPGVTEPAATFSAASRRSVGEVESEDSDQGMDGAGIADDSPAWSVEGGVIGAYERQMAAEEAWAADPDRTPLEDWDEGGGVQWRP